MGDDSVLHRIVPKTALDEVPKEPRVDDLELASEDTTSVDVPVVEGNQVIATYKNEQKGRTRCTARSTR